MPSRKEKLPGTLERSPAKVQRTYAETLDSAHVEYDSEERAHRTAWSAVKHVAEKRGDHWELKDEPGPSDDSIQLYLVDELYRKVIHRDAETLGMEICLPVWKHREFIDAHRYDHAGISTLLLVTTEETRLEDLLARKVATGDIGATANTIVVMGSERVGTRLARMLCVVKHRGSAMSDEIVEYRIGASGLELG